MAFVPIAFVLSTEIENHDIFRNSLADVHADCSSRSVVVHVQTVLSTGVLRPVLTENRTGHTNHTRRHFGKNSMLTASEVDPLLMSTSVSPGLFHH